MSSRVGKLKHEIKNKLIFPEEMYNTFIGSALICNYIFEQWPTEELKRVLKLWKTIKRNPTNYFTDIESIWNINKIYEIFKVKRTWDFPVCIVTSDFNCLVVPYSTDEDKIIPLPIREDCFYPATVRKAKSIQVVDWNGDLQSEENKSESSRKSE